MNQRIAKLAELTLAGKMYVPQIKTEFNKTDMFLPDGERTVKQICEYIMNQRPLLTKYSALGGYFNFDDSVVGDIFRRYGHKHLIELNEAFYLKRPIEDISTVDAQHGTSDYRNVLTVGIPGIIAQIDESIAKHTQQEKIDFLCGLKRIAETLVLWLKKCSDITREYAQSVTEPQYKSNLEALSAAMDAISERAPRSFYEAVLTIHVCFSFNPDSIGTLDRYLSDFYFADVKAGVLDRERAGEYLSELFLTVQAVTHIDNPYFTRGGQSHFCIGGRDKNGNDCYNELSELILDSLMELPTYIPQITLRWTHDTPRRVLRHALECDRRDKNKRLAFTNDDKRIKAYTEICGFPYEEAINYTLVGCNEPAMLGGLCASTSHANLAKPLETVLHQRSDEIASAQSFDEFYAVFRDQFYRDLDKIYHYDDLYNLKRGKDVNYASCLFLNGCIENGKSVTQGGVNYAVSTIMFLGNVTLIDGLSIIRQFVYDDRSVDMPTLLDALHKNWEGYEELRMLILKRGNFFGNDDDCSNEVAKRVYEDLYQYVKDKRTVYGYPVLLGDHTGYPMHFAWFGETTRATPDGRCAGDPLSYGIFQTEGKARNGLSAQMNAITGFDPRGISSATVTNFSLDNSYIKNEEYFEKTLDMLQAYFQNGGMQFQLNYVSRQDLVTAKAHPEKYPHLRVRVTGYSDYFSKLTDQIQDSVIARYKE